MCACACLLACFSVIQSNGIDVCFIITLGININLVELEAFSVEINWNRCQSRVSSKLFLSISA